MTAEPIARVVADLRAGRVRHVVADPRLNEIALKRATTATVVDATAIYDALVLKDEVWVYEDHPCIAPPWESAAVCYVNEHGNCIVMQVTADEVPERRRRKLWGTAGPVDWDRVRWVLDTFVYMGGRSKEFGALATTGPAHMWRFAVYEDGAPADLSWIQLMPERPLEHWDTANLTLLGALNFMSCRNVSLVEPVRPRPSRRRLDRLGVKVHTINVKPAGKSYRGNGSGENAGVPLTSVRGHFACVDEETEILTRRGWLKHQELDVGDDVAGYDVDTGESGWTSCDGVHRYDYDGPMVVAKCRALSMKLTPNHRVLATRARRIRRGVEVMAASELRPKYVIPRTLPNWHDDGREKAIGVELAALCGWVAAEGHVTPGGYVGLCQSSSVNRQHVEAIDDILRRIDYPPPDVSGHRRPASVRREIPRRHVDPDGMVRWQLPLGLSQELLRIMPDKLMPTWFVDLPIPEAEAVLKAFADGDGHRNPDGRTTIVQKRRECLDVLQSMAVRLGWKSSIHYRPNGDSTAKWELALSHGPDAVLRRSSAASLISTEWHKGVVWCPTTGTGTFVARRDGHVFVTGNSYGPAYGKGLLFGKFEGRFWVPQFARGSKEFGETVKDYRLAPRRAESDDGDAT